MCAVAWYHPGPWPGAVAAGGPSQGFPLQVIPIPSSDSLPRRLPQSATFPVYSPVLCLSLPSAGAASLHCASPTFCMGWSLTPLHPTAWVGKQQYTHTASWWEQGRV